MLHNLAKFLKRRIKPTALAPAAASAIEPLEARQLMSSTTLMYDSRIIAAATSAAAIQGYTPAEIREAYGFSSATFPNSTTAADGAGQTIAIVDAYNDPNIQGDLQVFDEEFGIAAPASFKVVNQTGGSTLPTTDAGWAGEISLDVEWAHAIAPGANILLVEADSDNIPDLMQAVDYVRGVTGVSTVSMSWGGSEFFSWGGGESSSQTYYDNYFTTPSGHQGITFVAAAGDSGQYGGVEWPASSPNVLSVGGTSLYTSSGGAYSNEQSWSGTSSGYSEVEYEPSYQDNVQTSGARSVADVSYDADPNTGFAVYDSLADQGYVGWQEVGGTSAGSPQWAALIAIADEGRVLAGETTLDGVSQTLPMLYNLYNNSTTYSDTFNDVVDTNTGYSDPWQWRWGGFGYNQYAATTGYDTVTGLGTPKAGALIDALITNSSTTGSTGSNGSSSSSGSSGSSGSGGSGTTTAALPASPLDATFSTTPIGSGIEGTTETVTLTLTNTNGDRFVGPVTVALYASSDNSLSSDDTLITTIDLPKVTVKAGSSKTEKLKFAAPTSLANGTYYVVGSVTAVGTGTAAAEADAAGATTFTAPTVDLATSFTKGGVVNVNPGHGENVAVTISNEGNVAANGTFSVNLFASDTAALDPATEQLLTALSGKAIHLKAGKSVTLHLHFTAPANEAAGAYYLVASTTSNTNPLDANSANDVAVASTAVAG